MFFFITGSFFTKLSPDATMSDSIAICDSCLCKCFYSVKMSLFLLCKEEMCFNTHANMFQYVHLLISLRHYRWYQPW